MCPLSPQTPSSLRSPGHSRDSTGTDSYQLKVEWTKENKKKTGNYWQVPWFLASAEDIGYILFLSSKLSSETAYSFADGCMCNWVPNHQQLRIKVFWVASTVHRCVCGGVGCACSGNIWNKLCGALFSFSDYFFGKVDWLVADRTLWSTSKHNIINLIDLACTLLMLCLI